MISAVPGEAPLGVMGYNTSSTSINVTWSPPPPDVIFGILRRFEIRYFISSQPHLKDYITNLTDTATAFEIRGLEKFTNYSIEVSAVTIGNGPFSTPIYVVTDEDGTFHFTVCSVKVTISQLFCPQFQETYHSHQRFSVVASPSPLPMSHGKNHPSPTESSSDTLSTMLRCQWLVVWSREEGDK